MVRSPYAHATIEGVDTAAAAAMPGRGRRVHRGRSRATRRRCRSSGRSPRTSRSRSTGRSPKDKARYAGDGVAVVVAETREQAKDAAEAVSVDYDRAAGGHRHRGGEADDAPLVHEELGTNVVVHWSPRRRAATRPSSTTAPVVVTGALRPAAPDPERDRAARLPRRAVPAMGEFTLWTSTQIPHIAQGDALRRHAASPSRSSAWSRPTSGGGFGSKLNVYAEEALALALAREARPAREVDRGALARTTSRRSTAAASTRRRARRRPRTARSSACGSSRSRDMGAYYQLLTPGIPELGAGCTWAPTTCRRYWYEFTRRVTNTHADRRVPRRRAPRGDLRRRAGHGRAGAQGRQGPGRGPAHEPPSRRSPRLRRRSAGCTVDSGELRAARSTSALELVDYDGSAPEQQARRDRGDAKQLGIGLTTYIEMCGLAPSRSSARSGTRPAAGTRATIECLPTGKVW